MKRQLGFLLIAAVTLSACANTNKLPNISTSIGKNQMAVTVGSCGSSTYINEPCVSVTICAPGTSSCQVIPNLLLDTGSYGLRIFSSVVTVSLPRSTDSTGKPVAECAQFGTGSMWGPVKTADVVLASESSVRVPVQVVNATYGNVPSNCTGLDTDPASAGYNGILGVGLFAEDCGTGCANIANNQIYFSCDIGGTNNCTSIKWPTAQQVLNPVSALPNDNNGVILSLPSISSSGAQVVNGTLTLGIGTQSNNTPGSVTVFPADSAGNFTTVFNGNTYSTSFIDSGSNGLFFPSSSITQCSNTGSAPGFYCPASLTSLSGVQVSGGTQKTVNFQILNAESITSGANGVFNDLGGSMTGSFDWGLPFFLGRTIYSGIDGKPSVLGTGPYWAY